MPHLASLVERGVSGVLESQLPSRSPRLWTTIATGRQPDEHGILDFVRPEEDAVTGRPLAYTSNDRRVKAFWNLFSDHGVSNTTIGWWMTHPVEPVLGSMVAQTNVVMNGLKKGTFDPRAEQQVWPPEDEGRLREVLIEQYATLPERLLDVFGEFPFELTTAERRRWQQCQWSFRADGLYVAAQEDILARGRGSRVTAIYLGGTDVVGHRFWAAYRPEDFELPADGREARAFGHVIPAYYAWVDSVLGELLESYPPDTTFLIVSDHGMSSRPLETMGENFVEEHTGSHNHGLVSGAFIAAGPGIRVAPPSEPLPELDPRNMPRLGSILDFCPTLLALVDVPYGERMSGRPLQTVLDQAFLERHPLRSVPTHDYPAWLAARSGGTGPAVGEDAERLEQLRQLGYLGGEEEE